MDENRWTAGFRFHAWAAARVFRAADLVFGADNPRVVKALATRAANPWIAARHLETLRDRRHNPWGVKASVIAIAPCFGHGVDGAAPDVVDQLPAAIDKAADHAARRRALADEHGLKLYAYEGGQHVTKNARAINTSPAMHGLYQRYLAAMSEHVEHFAHYCHLGRAGEGGAWGALERTGQPLSEAPKQRALVEYVQKSGPPRNATESER